MVTPIGAPALVWASPQFKCGPLGVQEPRGVRTCRLRMGTIKKEL